MFWLRFCVLSAYPDDWRPGMITSVAHDAVVDSSSAPILCYSGMILPVWGAR